MDNWLDAHEEADQEWDQEEVDAIDSHNIYSGVHACLRQRSGMSPEVCGS